MKILYCVVFVFSFFLPPKAFSKSLRLFAEPNRGKVLFEAMGNPGFLKIEGVGEGPFGHVDLAKEETEAEVFFKLDTLKTGIDMRDEHMKERYLNVEKNPLAKLTIQLGALSDKNDLISLQKSRARLLLNGVEREIEVSFQNLSAHSGVGVHANFKLKLENYKIEIPSFAGVTLADEVQVQVETVFIDEVLEKESSLRSSL